MSNASQPSYEVHRIPSVGAGRGLIVGVLRVTAVVMMLPGLLTIVYGIVLMLTEAIGVASEDFTLDAIELGAGGFLTGGALTLAGVLMMSGGALVSLLLYMEEHLFRLTRRPVR